MAFLGHSEKIALLTKYNLPFYKNAYKIRNVGMIHREMTIQRNFQCCSECSQRLLHVLHVNGHKLGHKGLQVVNGLAALVQAMLIEGGPLGDLEQKKVYSYYQSWARDNTAAT